MNRTDITTRGVLILTAMLLLPGMASGQENTAWAALGELRADTLHVSRDNVIALALAQNEMLAASDAMTDAAAADAQGAWRAFLPQVQVSEFFLRSDDALMSFGYKLQNRTVTQADFNPVLLNDPGETNNFITRFQAMMPIFNGGSGLSGKRAANAMSRSAEHKHVRAAETIRFHAVQAFEGLALAEAYSAVMDAAVASAAGHVRQAQSMVDNEMATEADLLQAKVYLSALQQRHIEVRNMMAVAGENIKLLTAVDTPLPLAADLGANAATALALHGRFDLAAARGRSDILARREEAKAAGSMVGVAQGSLLPHLNMSVQRDLYSSKDLFGSDAKSWTLGVYATWDIFSGMQNIGELKKARAQKRAAQHMVDFETRQAKVQATEALLTAKAAYEKVLVAQDAVTAAREGLRIVTNQYREGLASMVNLLDTQAAATMAEGNLVQARHDYQVGLAQLEYAGAARVVAAGTQDPTPDQAR
jgi:outer membrane protein TolC